MSGSFVVSVLAAVTLTTALALTAIRLAGRSRAAFRHVLLAASFAVLAVLPVAPLAVPSIPVAIPIAAPSEAMAPAIEFVTDVMAPGAGSGSPLQATGAPRSFAMPSASTLLLTGWIAGAVFFLAPVAVGLWQIRTIRRSALPWRHGESVAARAGADLGVRQRVDVHMHECVAGPMTCGIARPTVLFPIDAADWPHQEIDRAIVHELEHVRRHDWLSQCLARVVCAIYWFHPLVWIARRAFELEAERACDDAVLLRAEATGYADQLVGLAARLSSTHRRPLLAMASRRDLAARVRALLDGRQARGRAGTTAIATACVVAVALVLTMSSLRIVTRAQTADLKFDAASVRPHQDDGVGRRDFRASYGPQNIDFQGLSLGYIIGEAYAVQNGHVVGATDQVTGTLRGLKGYDIEARAPRPATRDELRVMLQALLADRFKLTIHRENRELQVFRLVAASGGPKLTRAQSGDFQSTASSDGFVFRNAEVSRLTSLLTSFVGREVVDETGLKGLYDFTVRMPDGYTPASAKMGIATGNAPDAASFAGPLRELGLQLVSGKAAVEFLVVDHVERPTSNDAAAAGQSSAPQRFEAGKQKFDVASIRSCAPEPVAPGARSGGGGSGSFSPGRARFDCFVVKNLIQTAYVNQRGVPAVGLPANVKAQDDPINNYPNLLRLLDPSSPQQVRGGPAWVYSDKYTIETEAAGLDPTSGASADRRTMVGPMLQALLEERFGLKLHRETEQAPMYALTVAKTGLRLKPIADDDCNKDRPVNGPPITMADALARGVKPTCGTILGGPHAGNWQYQIAGQDLTPFAHTLGSDLGVNVIDRTGVSDKFNFVWEYGPDENTPGVKRYFEMTGATDSAPPTAPNVFAALKQLGLELEKITGTRAYFAIDHIDRPAIDGLLAAPSRARGSGK